MANWLIYALGGGWGHLNRAVALGRRAAEKHQVQILTNSPYAHWVQAQIRAGALNTQGDTPELRILATEKKTAETRCHIQHQIRHTEFDCLIVDTFPRGLGGELVACLPQLTVPKVLIHRAIASDYVQAKALKPWVSQHYDLILVPGEPEDACFVDLPQAIVTEPWLMWSALELPSSPTQAQVVVIAGGNLEELTFWGAVTTQLQAAFPQVALRCLAFQQPPGCPEHCWLRHWPGMTVLQQADVIIGGAGYNTVFEAVALGIPLITFPFKRLYDRQHRRAVRWTCPVSSIGEAIQTLSVVLQNHQRTPMRYLNGVDRAVPLIDNSVRCNPESTLAIKGNKV